MKRFRSYLATILLSIVTLNGYAQTAEVKVNLLAGAVAIFNPSIEVGFGNKSAITMDYVGVYAEENYMNTGYPFLFTMGLFGYRHYIFNNNHKGFFIGGDFGLDQFRMNKNIIPIVVNDHGDDGYDVGHGYLFGATLGYKYNISRRFNIEASISGGWHHARHECYTGEGVRTVELNASAEWLLYKAGISLSYIFGSSAKSN